jgi:biofilm PGA synthesis lipoprotein PgaB
MKKILFICLMLCVSAIRAHSSDVIVLCYHDVRDDVRASRVETIPEDRTAILPAWSAEHLDPDQYAISTHNLASHFDWLQAHGYHVISLQQLIDARTGHGTLPAKAVLLTFDDGLSSAYSKVFPLLKAFHYPAVVSVVGAWADLPSDGKVDYGPRSFTRADFATWDQLREMQDSGLVEIASHTYDMHKGIQANPQGNLIPAAISHAYDARTQRYESDEEYEKRIRADLSESAAEIRTRLGRAPRAVMWPYGEYTQRAETIATSLGMPVSLTLSMPTVFPERSFGELGIQAIPRLVMMSNPDVSSLAWSVKHSTLMASVRAVQVDTDYIYDRDPAQQERNLSALLDRIQSLNVTQVWVQAFADPTGSGSATAVYFPSQLLPMRADLLSRMAWQLRTRCGVQVFAWMPVLAWHLPDQAQQARLQIRTKPGSKSDDPERLNPFLPETRKIVGDLYEEMGRAAPVAGILFHDDGVLRDTDKLGPQVPAPGPERTRALIEFTNELTVRVQQWRPQVVTARNLFAEAVLRPESETWSAQSFPAFLATYDEVALMAMPYLENAGNPNKWLRDLERKAAAVPGGLNKTVFELQTTDWRTKSQIPTRTLAAQMRLLQSKGSLHLAYYPDDFVKNNPAVKELIPVFSASSFPALRP